MKLCCLVNPVPELVAQNYGFNRSVCRDCLVDFLMRPCGETANTTDSKSVS